MSKQQYNTRSQGWVIRGNVILEEETFEVGKFNGKKLYAHIPYEYGDVRFIRALENGLINRSEGKSGIKILEKSLFELKYVKSDERLYTSKIYQNSDNKLLISFDNSTNHKNLAKLLRHSHLETIFSSLISEDEAADCYTNHEEKYLSGEDAHSSFDI